MPRKAIQSDLSNTIHDQISELTEHGRRSRAVHEGDIAPDFERNKKHLLEVWEVTGRVALIDLREAIRELGPYFDAAAKMPFDDLMKSGIPAGKIIALEETIDRTKAFMGTALTQLSGIKPAIDKLTFEDERSNKIGCKGSDILLFEMRGVLSAAQEIRQAFEKMKHQIDEISAFKRQLAPDRSPLDIAAAGSSGRSPSYNQPMGEGSTENVN